MTGGKSLRIGLIIGAVVLTAVIYLLPKTPQGTGSKPVETSLEADVTGFSIEEYLEERRKALPSDTAERVKSLEEAIRDQPSDTQAFDSIARIWDDRREHGLAAWYFERKATLTETESDWVNASYRYFDAFKMSSDSIQASFYFGKAERSYTKVLELNPKNLNAKTDLALIYTQNQEQPMKGIMMLREVVAEDPKHENAQLNLGFLSMKSGQYDKAVERFKTVLEINPSRIEMYLYSGEAYLRMGNKEKALEQFNIFKNLSNDTEMIKEVDSYLEKIKSGS